MLLLLAAGWCWPGGSLALTPRVPFGTIIAHTHQGGAVAADAFQALQRIGRSDDLLSDKTIVMMVHDSSTQEKEAIATEKALNGEAPAHKYTFAECQAEVRKDLAVKKRDNEDMLQECADGSRSIVVHGGFTSAPDWVINVAAWNLLARHKNQTERVEEILRFATFHKWNIEIDTAEVPTDIEEPKTPTKNTHSQCTDCGSDPCTDGSNCYSCCLDAGNDRINLYDYSCGGTCSNSPCPSSSRRRSPPPPPPPSSRRQSPPPPSPSGGGGGGNQGYEPSDIFDFDFSALFDVEVPRGLTVSAGLFGIVAGAVMGTHGCVRVSRRRYPPACLNLNDSLSHRCVLTRNRVCRPAQV